VAGEPWLPSGARVGWQLQFLFPLPHQGTHDPCHDISTQNVDL